jgi:HKD family nuclease
MKTELIIQPENEMAREIRDLLDLMTGPMNRAYLISAFANRSAIRYLAPNIRRALKNGADVQFLVGIDMASTSAEAIRAISAFGTTAHILHNSSSGHTFHPKVFLFELGPSKAVLIVGSNNLTTGGLYTNYEAATKTTFDLPQDANDYLAVQNALDRYINPSGPTVQVLTDQLVSILVQRGEVPTEKQMRRIRQRVRSATKRLAANRPATPFGAERTRSAPKLPKPTRKTTSKKTIITRQTIFQQPTRGQQVWEKRKLDASSVQRQSGNVTGGLRLTQAGWTANGHVIDHTRYFRYDVFGGLSWQPWKTKKPVSEAAMGKFRVILLGVDYGVKELRVSHKPSGEAGQRNYTTQLHWGELAGTVQGLNLVGRTLKLFAPASSADGTFTVEVT